MSFKGYASSFKFDKDDQENAFATIEPIRQGQHGLSVLAHMFMRSVGTDAVETADAGQSIFAIKATTHASLKGDVIRFTSGPLSGIEMKVYKVTANHIYLTDIPTGAANTNTFEILRHKYPTVAADGSLATSPGPIQFVLDGVDVEVEEDTGTPANSVPLPVKMLDAGGDIVDFATEATLQDALAELEDVNTNTAALAGVDFATEAKQDDQITLLTSIAAEDFATETSLAAMSAKLPATLGQKTGANSLAVILASDQALALPTGAATETTLAAASAKLPATLGQKAMAASLAVVLASDQASVPVAASQAGNWPVRAQDGSGNALTSEVIQTSLRPLHVLDLGLNIVDFFDTPVNDASSVNIAGSGTALGSISALVASLAANVKKIKCSSTVGEFIGIYDTTTLLAVVGPGQDDEIPVKIVAGTAIKIRSMATSTITEGKICLQFLG